MAKLERIWIGNNLIGDNTRSINFNWDNDRHHTIEIEGDSPMQVIDALRRAANNIEALLVFKKL